MLALPTTGILSATGLSTDGMLDGGTSLVLAGLDTDETGDDGGWEIVASGTFPTTQGVTFRLTDGVDVDEACYSGTAGSGAVCTSEDGGSCAFIVPPLPKGVYSLVATTEDGLYTTTLVDALTVIGRSFTDRLYNLRSQWPPPRTVGAYDISEES